MQQHHKFFADTGALDMPLLLRVWNWLVVEPLTPMAMSAFGDWFLIDAQGQVLRLDVLEGLLEPIASSQAEWEAQMRGEDEQLDWFQDGMCEALQRAGLILGPGECYGYIVPPIIGESLERSNIQVVQIEAWQWFMSQLHEQIQPLPSGTHITGLRVNDDGIIAVEYAVS